MIKNIFDSGMNHNTTNINFSCIKTISIFTVLIGHYFGGYFWIPTTFALCIFGFSSGYFTSKNYENKTAKEYYGKKLHELPIRLVTINIFIVITILITKEQYNLFNIYSIIHIFGLSGFLNWMSVENESSLGLGLWYLTVLLIFYASYPAMHHVKRIIFNKLTLIYIYIILYYLQIVIPLPHMLWITIFSFYYGCYTQKNKNNIIESIIIIILISILMASISYTIYNQKNYGFVIISIFSSIIPSIIYFKILINIVIIKKICTIINLMLLEIYMIHPYLFVYITNSKYTNFIISILIILISSTLLFSIYKKLTLSLQHIKQF